MFPWPPSEGRRVDGAPTLRTPLERRERNGSPQKSANRRMTEPRETGADDSNNNHQRSAQREQRHGGTQRLDMASRFIEGNMKSDYDEPGLVFDPGATRVERLGEAVVIAKRLLEGESVTFAGRHYRVTNHTIHPLPVQRPRPPIFIGGSAPRLLDLAAKEADIVGLTGIAFRRGGAVRDISRSEEHTSELQSHSDLVCRLLLEKKKNKI